MNWSINLDTKHPSTFFLVQRRYKYILVVKEGETLAWEHDMSHRHIRDISHFTTQDREKKNKAKMSTRKLRKVFFLCFNADMTS